MRIQYVQGPHKGKHEHVTLDKGRALIAAGEAVDAGLEPALPYASKDGIQMPEEPEAAPAQAQQPATWADWIRRFFNLKK